MLDYIDNVSNVMNCYDKNAIKTYFLFLKVKRLILSI